MNSATIPLAAMATFAAVYWLTPAPVPVEQAQPALASVVEPEPAALPETTARPSKSRPAVVREARPVELRRNRPARPRRSVVASADEVRPVRRAVRDRVYYSGCKEVRAAGLAPLFRGEPGYRPEMDGDDDGIACEPYRGRR